MIELWKDIKGYEGHYQISNLGRVKSLARNVYNQDGTFSRVKNENIKKNKLSKDGYYSVTLSVNGKSSTFLVHRLVAIAFVDNPYNYSEVNHKDLNRGNNKCDNLEWCNHKENVRYSANLGMYSKPFGHLNSNSRSVTVLDDCFRIISHFECIIDCANWLKNNLSIKAKISSICGSISSAIIHNKQYYSLWFK